MSPAHGKSFDSEGLRLNGWLCSSLTITYAKLND